MSKENRQKLIKEFKEISTKVSELDKELTILAEDLAYRIKLFIRESSLSREDWCKKHDIDIETFDEDLAKENIFSLKKYLDLILGNKPEVKSLFTSIDKSKSIPGLSRVVKALKENDAEKIWNAISYYILMNHKNIQKYCEDYSKSGFNIKYSTFRTDKYNKALNTAKKYASMIVENNN
ncbi:MAG: hypothetical protein CR982_07680 [Candidatus Cloacimonadota bacterium]|nr:MAG: hypothetical protein CR982_07680 [Candidatus Cloacimonadota bacterium]PIE78265.1 MAG: hypothetical protein CSA15_08860 [Candidatus Delongbacteria bacterium]